jgi:hypothetical protein
MADFPALEPTRRAWALGAFPSSQVATTTGGPVRFIHAGTPGAHPLELFFEELTAAEAALIRRHWLTQRGPVLAFLLGDATRAPRTAATDIAPAGYRWGYVDPPEFEDLPGGFVNVTVRLESRRPPRSVRAIGARFLPAPVLATGSAGSPIGAALTTTPVLVTGAATGS